MKFILTILIVFLLAFAASCLLELDFIASNPVRYSLTVFLVIIILLAGLYVGKSLAMDEKSKNK